MAASLHHHWRCIEARIESLDSSDDLFFLIRVEIWNEEIGGEHWGLGGGGMDVTGGRMDGRMDRHTHKFHFTLRLVNLRQRLIDSGRRITLASGFLAMASGFRRQTPLSSPFDLFGLFHLHHSIYQQDL